MNYDIVDKIKDTAHQANDVGLLREFRPANGVVGIRISQDSIKSNPSDE